MKIKDFKVSRNNNTTYKNLWDIAKALTGGKFVALNAYVRKHKISNQ